MPLGWEFEAPKPHPAAPADTAVCIPTTSAPTAVCIPTASAPTASAPPAAAAAEPMAVKEPDVNAVITSLKASSLC